MPFSGLSEIQILLLVIAILGTVTGIAVMVRFRIRPGAGSQPENVIKSTKRWQFWLEVSLGLLASALILTLLWMMLGLIFGVSTVTLFCIEVDRLLPLMLIAPPVASLLVLRWIRSGALGVWVAGILFFGGTAIVFQMGRADFQRVLAVDTQALPAYYADSYLIPSHSMSALYLGVLAALFLFGLAAYSFHRRWYSFLIGSLVLPQVTYWVIRQSMIVFHFNAETARMFADLFTPQDSGYLPLVGLNWRELLLVNFTLGTVFALIWSQRQQREGLLRAAGILESEQENRATKSLGAIGRHLFVGLTCLHVGLVFLTFHLTAAVGRQIAYGPPILPRSERLVNGWDAMNARFTRTTIPSATMTELGNGLNFAQIAPIEPKNFPAASSFVSVKDLMTSSVFRAEMAKFEQRFSPWINDFKTAAEADYLSPNTGKQYVIPSFLHLRTIVRWLSLSSQVAMSDGDWKKALEPIEILYRYTALEMDGILVGHMIHVAIKGIANQTGTLYWQAFYDNREAMDALAAVLERASASNRRSFPWENIQRHEPSHSPVVVYADIMVPSYTRAVGTYEQASSGMDQLTIATASARMRKETGAWPTTIDEIPTKFLPASVARSAKSSKLQFAVEPDQLRIQRSADPTTGTQAGRLPALRFLIQSSAAHP